MTTRPCQVCGAELPPHTRSQSFLDPKTGRLEYHTEAMARWFANKDGRLEEIEQWQVSDRGSKKGLVTGYTYRTGHWGHKGAGLHCSAMCAARAAKKDEGGARAALPSGGSKAPDIGAPQPTGKVFSSDMTGRRFQQIREGCGATATAFAKALGYVGSAKALYVIVQRFETERRKVPPTVARLAYMFERHGIPRGTKT
jgi:hypothetical protein